MMKIKVAYSHSNVSLITFKTQAGNRAWFFICGGISNARPRSLPLKKKKREKENESKQPEKDLHMLTPSTLPAYLY